MSRPSKPAKVISLEGRSHRTKRELAIRERGENALLTGKKMSEFRSTKDNILAHAEFLRVSKLLKSIDKNDDLYANSINRYCTLHAELDDMEKQKDYLWDQIQKLEDSQDAFDDASAYYSALAKLQKGMITIDKQVQAKRSMMLAIEKENLLTIASAMRSVPKQPETKTNVLREALVDDG